MVSIVTRDQIGFRSDLARQYRTKTSEMEVRRIEVERLSKEFEAKLRQKEVQSYQRQKQSKILVKNYIAGKNLSC